MMVLWTVLACETTEPSWDLLGPRSGPVETLAPSSSPEPGAPGEASSFPSREEEASLADPWAAPAPASRKTSLPRSPRSQVVLPDTEPQVPSSAQLPPLLEQPPERVGWGIRLLNTLPQAQPPRAAIGLPDGSEVVLRPGDMLEEHGIVLLWVGRDQAQIAEVTPAGDHATVTSRLLEAQYPLSRGADLE